MEIEEPTPLAAEPDEPEELTEPEQPSIGTSLITTEVAIIAVVVVAVIIGIATYWLLRRK